MNEEKELTVLVTVDYSSLHNELLNNGFLLKEKNKMKDIYMLNNNINVKILSIEEILKNTILVRHTFGINKLLLYKYKKYNNKGELLKETKTYCKIDSIKDGVKFMESINYKKLFEITDEYYIYSNGNIELAIQKVNKKYIFIEYEDHSVNKNKSIEEMKSELDSLNLSYDKSNYFVSKAKIILKEILK